MAVLTDNGIEIQKLGGILQDLQKIAKKKFADLVSPQDELDVSDSSVLGRILGIIAEPEAYNEELLFQLWQSLDPDQATGIFLDKILSLVGISRKSETKGFSGLMLHGTIGVTVPSKSLISSSITGDVFETTSDVTFRNIYTNGVVINIKSVGSDREYRISHSSSFGANTYPTIIVKGTEKDTKEMAAKRIMETVNSVSKTIYAVVNNDDEVVIRYFDMNKLGNFSVSDEWLNIKESFMPVSSISVTTNAVRQNVDTLNVIQTSVIGWLGVTNPYDSIPSEPKESDKDFRFRGGISKSLKSVSNRVALYSELFSMEGVQFVNIKENIYDNPTGGRSSKGISVVVLGGDDREIAKTILGNVPLGCATDGILVEKIKDDVGISEVRFSRPEFIPIKIKLSLSTDTTFPQNGKVLIQEALVRYFDSLDVGDNVVWSKLFNPINEVTGQSVNSLLIGISDNSSEVLQSESINMKYNQLAVISFEDIEF